MITVTRKFRELQYQTRLGPVYVPVCLLLPNFGSKSKVIMFIVIPWRRSLRWMSLTNTNNTNKKGTVSKKKKNNGIFH